MIDLRTLDVVRGGRPVLSGINLRVKAGELTAVVGPNGAGKSSLLATIVGDVEHAAGAVTIDGFDVRSLGPGHAAQVRAFLSQDHPTDIDYSVEMVVEFGTYALEGDRAAAVRQAMEAVDIEGLRLRPFSELSGGEQRRTMIARVFAQQAPAILMDEPTDSLDLGHADLVMRAALSEAKANRTVLVTSHDLNIASRHADRIVLLAGGQIVGDGAPSDVFTEDLLSRVYGTQVRIRPHPDTDLPVVFL